LIDWYLTSTLAVFQQNRGDIKEIK